MRFLLNVFILYNLLLSVLTRLANYFLAAFPLNAIVRDDEMSK